MLRICFALGLPFWFLRFTVCYHDSRPMLPIAFYPGKIMKILIFFVIGIGHLDRVLDFLLCFFCNKSVLIWSFSLSVSYRYNDCTLPIAFYPGRPSKFSKPKSLDIKASLFFVEPKSVYLGAGNIISVPSFFHASGLGVREATVGATRHAAPQTQRFVAV